jgi:hypothetical protein
MKLASPRLVWRSYAVPKGDGRSEDLEDAFAGDSQRGRFAIADGASESAFAAAWAALLVTNYVQKPRRWSSLARESWEEQCQRPEMPWYLEHHFEEGAFAAFLGVSFRGPHQWQAVAIGDCCLFHVRNGDLRFAFPVSHSNDFGNRPTLLCSRHHPGRGNTRRIRADWRDDDLLLLATDALAKWFLGKVEKCVKPWDELLCLASQEQFAGWIRRVRDSREICNDDTTVLIIGTESKGG